MSDEVVLVTGASGYIGSHVVKVLLDNGYKVRGTVRSLQNETKVDALKKLFENSKHPLELVEADLTKDDCWDKAMEGCTYLMHVASPFPNVAEITVKEEDVVIPAKEGTMRVLKAAAKAKIKKVVLTSSIVSICADTTYDLEKVYTEDDWSDPENPAIDVYSKSKVLAEKLAWDYQKELEADEKFDLIVINPSFVLGPVLLEEHKHATSVTFLSQILNRTYPAYPKLSVNFCDVRDVAAAHMMALTAPEAVGKRHIIFTERQWLKDIAVILSQEFRAQGYYIFTGEVPYFACWIAALFVKSFKSYILPRFGKPAFTINNERMKVLGIEPTPIETSVNDMAYSLIDADIIKKTKKYKQVGSRAEVQTEEKPVENPSEEQEPQEKKEESAPAPDSAKTET